MSEDLIRRSDAIDAITNISKNYTGKGKRDYHPHIDFLVDALKCDVPSIEPKHGEWIHDIAEVSEFREMLLPNCKCSVCGCGVQCEANFCPNCGADMRKREDK